MKHLRITSWAAGLLAVALLSGCSKEQSEVTIDDIQGRATIVGSLCYSQGQDFKNGQFQELLQPAVGVKVVIQVSNASLDPNGTAKGYTLYEATTNNEGKYGIEIPVVEDTRITVKPASFMGTRTLVSGWENNAPVMETEEVVFSIGNIASQTVSPGDIVVKDDMYSYTPRTFAETFNETEEIKGKIGIGKLYRQNDQRYWDVKSGINVIFTVTYNYQETTTGGQSANIVRKFGATTDNKGEFSVFIPVRAKGETLQRLTVEPVSFYESEFKHFDSAGDTEYLAGVYAPGGAYSGVYSNYTFPIIENIENPVCATMIFTEDKEGGYDDSFSWSYVSEWGTKSFE